MGGVWEARWRAIVFTSTRAAFNRWTEGEDHLCTTIWYHLTARQTLDAFYCVCGYLLYEWRRKIHAGAKTRCAHERSTRARKRQQSRGRVSVHVAFLSGVTFRSINRKKKRGTLARRSAWKHFRMSEIRRPMVVDAFAFRNYAAVDADAAVLHVAPPSSFLPFRCSFFAGISRVFEPPSLGRTRSPTGRIKSSLTLGVRGGRVEKKNNAAPSARGNGNYRGERGKRYDVQMTDVQKSGKFNETFSSSLSDASIEIAEALLIFRLKWNY